MHPQCRWQKDARHCFLSFHVNYQNRSGWSFPSVAHHVSSASGQAAAGVGQRADATVRFPWQQRRGSETRNVANTPSSHCSPTRCIAKDNAVLRGEERGQEESKCLYLSGCRISKIKRNGNFSSRCSCKGKGNPPRRPRFLRVKCVCSLKGSGWLLIRT